MPATVTIDAPDTVLYKIKLADGATPAGELSGSQQYIEADNEIVGYSNYWTAEATVDGHVFGVVTGIDADVTIANNPPPPDDSDAPDESEPDDGDDTDTVDRQVIEDFETDDLAAWADTDDVTLTDDAIRGDQSLAHDGEGFAKVTSGDGVDNPLGRYPERGDTVSYLLDPGALDGPCWVVAFGSGDGTVTSEHNIHVQVQPGGDVRLREEVDGSEATVAADTAGPLAPETVYEVALHYHADAHVASAAVYEYDGSRGERVTRLQGDVDPSHAETANGVVELWFAGGAQTERVDDIALVGASPDTGDGTDGSEDTTGGSDDSSDGTDDSDSSDSETSPDDGADESQDDGYGDGEYGDSGYGLVGPAVEPDRDGRTVYVAPGGDDDNGGTADAPLRTFEPVSEGGRLADEIGGGKLVIDGDLTLSAPSEGWESPADDITVTGKEGTRPTVTATWTADEPVFHVQGQTHNYFRGFNVDWDTDGVGWRAIRYDNCNTDGSLPLSDIEAAKAAGWVHNVGVRHCGNSAIMFGGVCVGGVIEHCDSRYHYGPAPGDRPGGDDADGVQMTGAGGEVHRGGVVQRNIISHVSDDGVDLYRARGVVVRDNIVLAAGYREDGSATDIEVAGKGIKLGGDDAGVDRGGNLALRNLVIGCGGAGIGANGANLPVDILFNTTFGNARKADRSYENDIELWTSPDGGPAGKRLHESRVVGNVIEQPPYVGSPTGDMSENIHDNHVGVEPISVADGDTATIGFHADADLSDIVDAGPLPEAIWPTPASEWYGAVGLDYNGSAPDLGAAETEA